MRAMEPHEVRTVADQKPATTTEVGPTSTTLADVRAINQALKRAPFDPDSARVSACNAAP